MSIESIIKRARPCIQEIQAYKSARSLMESSEGLTFLDANECFYEPYDGADNLARYADQQPKDMMTALAQLYDVQPEQLLAGRGADETIDLLVRTFCEAGDNVIITPPTFPIYAHAAKIQNTNIKNVPLTTPYFELDTDGILSAIDDNTKIIFLCSPNNPTGNLIAREDVKKICEAAKNKAIVLLEEIYIEFSDAESCLSLLETYPNLVITRSLSKAYAAAGVRCGVAMAHPEIIALMKKVLAVYPVPQPVLKEVLTILKPDNIAKLKQKIEEVKTIRDSYQKEFEKLECVQKVYPTQTNFFLIQFKDAKTVMQAAKDNGYILRDQSPLQNMQNCIRFSVASRNDMEKLFNIFSGISLG